MDKYPELFGNRPVPTASQSCPPTVGGRDAGVDSPCVEIPASEGDAELDENQGYFDMLHTKDPEKAAMIEKWLDEVQAPDEDDEMPPPIPPKSAKRYMK